MKYENNITHKVLKRFAKRVPDKGKFAFRDIAGARNHAERSALKRIENAGLFVKVGYGAYQRTSADPIKDYYANRRKGYARRGAPGVSKRWKSIAAQLPPLGSATDASITPWGEDDLWLIRFGSRRFLGPEIVAVPLKKKGNGVDEN